MPNGFMIAVEGADKAGKRTQVMNIMKYLSTRGIAAETLDFPQYNAYFGKFIKNYLNGNFGPTRELPAEYTMMPYAMDRLQHQEKIQDWLNCGNWVVLDRYTYSNSFSVAKCARELWDEKIKFMEELEFDQLKLIKPNHNIYLYVDPKISFEMRNQGLKDYQNGKADIHENDQKLLTDVSDVYRHIAKSNPDTWTIVDQMKDNNARMTIDEVFAKLKPIIDQLIKQNNTRFK